LKSRCESKEYERKISNGYFYVMYNKKMYKIRRTYKIKIVMIIKFIMNGE